MTKARDLANIISGGFTVSDLPTLTSSEIPNLDTAKITSGTFADARISESSVTAHVSATDLQPLKADITALALREATNEASAAFNLPNQFIETFTNDTNLLTQTTCDRNAGGFMETVTPGTNAFTTDSNTKFLLQSNTSNGSTTFTDESATGLTITAEGNTQHKTDQFKNGASSIYFDGSGDKLTTSDGGSTISGINGGDHCIEMWLRKDSTFTYTDHNTFQLGDELQWEWAAGKLGFYNYEAFGDWRHTNESSAASADAWHHYAQVRNSNNHKFYVDGSEVDTNDSGGGSGSSFANGIIRIGWHGSDANRYFKGWIDSVRISNSERGYSGGFTPPTGTTATTSATGTLIQSANTVASAKTKVGGTMLYKDNAGTATLGTDLKIYFSCNNGGAWTEAASYNAITPVYSTGVKQVRLGETTCTSGTGVIYKAVWANQAASSKETQLHGIGLNY